MFRKISPKTVPIVLDITKVSPDRGMFVVADVHGCFELLRDAVHRIDAFAEAYPEIMGAQPQLVFVGDYVDRGEQSAQALQWIFELSQQMPDAVVCLMGNHERMMLDFLDDPAGRGAQWLRNGGLQTLASYNIERIWEHSVVEELTEASLALEAALPDGLLDWMRLLPMMHCSGNVYVVHAAMDPHLGSLDQSQKVLLWGHKEFMKIPRNDNLIVVHGHTIVREPELHPSRISIDTGAYHSGRLTVAAISAGACEFI